jgi:hypothetical protein
MSGLGEPTDEEEGFYHRTGKKSLTLLRSVRDVFLFFVYWKPNNGGRDHNQTYFGNTSQNPDQDRILET